MTTAEKCSRWALSSWLFIQPCVTGFTSVSKRTASTRGAASAAGASSATRHAARASAALHLPRIAASQGAPASGPHGVPPLEPLEDLDEELHPHRLDVSGTRPGRRPDVDPDAEHDVSARLGEDARDLAAPDHHVVRVLHLGRLPDRLGDRVRREERDLGPACKRRRGPEHDGEREPRRPARQPRHARAVHVPPSGAPRARPFRAGHPQAPYAASRAPRPHSSTDVRSCPGGGVARCPGRVTTLIRVSRSCNPTVPANVRSSVSLAPARPTAASVRIAHLTSTCSAHRARASLRVRLSA